MNTLFFKLLVFTMGLSFFTGSEKTTPPVSTDPKIVLEHIQQFYSSHAFIYQELSYQLYADQQATIPYSIDRGIFIKQGEVQYAQLASIESLTTRDYTIGIDREEKIVMISNHISLPATGPIADADTWVSSEGSSVTLKPVSDRQEAVVVKMEYGEVEEADIIYEADTFQPVKLVLIYRRGIQLEMDPESPFVQPRLEVEYTRTSLDEQGQDRLDMQTYVTGKGKDWKLSPAYGDYELINNIHDFPEQN